MTLKDRKHIWIRYPKQKIIACRTCGLWINHFWKVEADRKGLGLPTKFKLGNPDFSTLEKFIECGRVYKDARPPIRRFQQTKYIWLNSLHSWEQHMLKTIDATQEVRCRHIRQGPMELATDTGVDKEYRGMARKIEAGMTRLTAEQYRAINPTA